MEDESYCPEKAVFYHGCPWVWALSNIRINGVVRGRYGSYYSSLPATYWSTSSVFVVWWCVTLEAKEKAIREGVACAHKLAEGSAYERCFS
jgi:hypothetical protein